MFHYYAIFRGVIIVESDILDETLKGQGHDNRIGEK
jgi:hypothetical protein